MGFAESSDSDDCAVEKLISGIRAWTSGLKIPKLKDLPGVIEEDFPRLVELAVQNGFTPSNVRAITARDYMRIIEEAYADHE
jgi:alcohol dehydrogenase class IV